LDRKERAEFQQFIQRNRRKEGRKDLALFHELVRAELPKKELQSALDLPNKNAYHALRKRLFQHLSDFILLRAVREDMRSLSRVNGLLSVARHLHENGSDRVAWKQLIRAEKLAIKHERYEALNTIYLAQIEQFGAVEDVPLATIVAKYEQNKEALVLRERVTITTSMIRDSLKRYKLAGKEVDLQAIVNESMATFELGKQIGNKPSLLADLLDTLRYAVAASKQFHAFEPIVAAAYSTLNNATDHYSNARILYVLAHAQYRNKKFQACEASLNTMEMELARCTRTVRRRLGQKLKQLRANNFMFLTELPSAIELLEELRADKFLDETNMINVKLSLTVFHFLHGDQQKARTVFSTFQRSDKWYKVNMGVEWSLKRDLIALLLYYELSELELVNSTIRSIRRKYTDIFAQSTYQRVPIFLSLIKEYMDKDTEVDLEALSKKVEGSWEWVPVEEEDLQIMMFFAWFKSKLTRKNLYETMLELALSK